ncbi:MAG: hypothetical protein JWN95_3245 [Frankiales bacterium]|nr:hypothetical protein [Frankiales bacterium]
MSVELPSRPQERYSPAPKAVRGWEWLDRFIGSDPGLTRLRLALQIVLTIALALVVEGTFVHLTHAIQIDTHGAELPPAQAAVIAAQHHALLVIALMLGAITGMLGGFAVNMQTKPRDQLMTLLILPVPMIGALALGLTLAPYRILALASLAVLLGGGTYLRRFGPLGFWTGQMLFMGDFFGFFLHGPVQLGDLGWLSAEIVLGAAVTVAVHFVLFFPHERRRLHRLQRSYAARARQTAAFAAELFESRSDPRRTSRQLHRQLVRLNEAALMIDAQLAEPTSLRVPASARILHQRLFDAEISLANMTRFAEAIVRMPLEDELRELVHAILSDVRDGDLELVRQHGRQLLHRIEAAESTPHQVTDIAQVGTDNRRSDIVLHRFATSVLTFADAFEVWQSADVADSDQDRADLDIFEPSVQLIGGWLPGSATVSAQASGELGPRRRDRIKLAPYSRVSIQMTVAVTLAIVLGDVLSGRRFYWAVIAAFVTFMGANNAGEQSRKSLFRVLGTFFGVMVGATLAHVVGTRTDLSIAVILVSLFLGLYLMRINYAFMVVGITIMVSQLYVQLDEYSNALLVLRLEETAIGAGVAILTSLLVLPLRTGHVVRVAAREYVTALIEVVDVAVQRMIEPEPAADLRTAARQLDAAYQALVTTAKPLTVPLAGRVDGPLARYLSSAMASRNYARNLVIDAAYVHELDDGGRDELRDAARTLRTSLSELLSNRDGRAGAGELIYVRSASLFGLVATRLARSPWSSRSQLALRDLQLIDSAMAPVAEAAGLTVRDLDTATVNA